jgi:hypothetical protein
LGQCVGGLGFRSFSGITSRNATLPGSSDDHPSRRPRPGRALNLAVRAPEALRQRIYTTSVDATTRTGFGTTIGRRTPVDRSDDRSDSRSGSDPKPQAIVSSPPRQRSTAPSTSCAV